MNRESKVDLSISFDRLERYIADDWGVTSPEYEEFQLAQDAVADLISAVKFLMPRILSTNGADCVDRMEAALDRIGELA